MKKLINGLLLFICTFTFADETPYIVEAVAENLDHPWSIAFLPDNTYLISLRSGSLHRLSEDGVLGPGISGLPNTYSQGQGGFFDVVLDPNFTNNQRIYWRVSRIDNRIFATCFKTIFFWKNIHFCFDCYDFRNGRLG